MKKVVFSVVLVVLMVLSVAMAANAKGDLLYETTQIVGLWPTAINNHGEISGRVIGGQAGIWRNGRLETILDGFYFSEAFALNDRGTALVAARKTEHSYSNRFFLIRKNGKIKEVNVPEGSILHGLNNSDQVVGENEQDHVQRGFIWDDGQLTWLTTDSSYATMTDINDHGQAAGFLWGAGFGEQPFVWSEGQLTYLQAPLLPGFDGSFCDARPGEINDAGMIAGYYVLPSGWGDWYPVVWYPDGRMVQLDQMKGKADGINNQGEILGHVEPPGELWQTVIWPEIGADPVYLEQHLNEPLRIISAAMNDRGQIICYGIRPDYSSGYFLLNPQRK